MPKEIYPLKFIKVSKLIPPYYAVIFSSTLGDKHDGYTDMALKMEKLAAKQPGFLGMETARDKIGITVSYWRSLEAIDQWRNHLEHKKAKDLGKQQWYKHYSLKICQVIQ
jgi:heme-degrading monooxygenase HmoA